MDLWEALADPSQVEDAILNLAVNARDAMPSGGQLVIETSNAELDEDYAAQNVEVTPGDYVGVSITNSGTGMPPEVLERVFEPFFTTKEVGRGTGLGLSMVYGFVKQSRGHVKIYSEVGHGTRITVYLPRAAPPTWRSAATLRPRARNPVGRRDGPGGRGQRPVRQVAVRMLRGLGYQVREAEDGPSALAILERARQDRSAVHRPDHAEWDRRAGTVAPRARAAAGPQGAVHVRLFGALPQGPEPDRGGGSAPEQALSLAISCRSGSRRARRRAA